MNILTALTASYVRTCGKIVIGGSDENVQCKTAIGDYAE